MTDDERCLYCEGGQVIAMSYPIRNVESIQCSVCGGTGLRKDDHLLGDKALEARLAMVKAKHERTGGPDEQQLADWGRTS